MTAIQPGDIPFTTSDAILAFSLYMAGVPLHDPKHPCLNIYDAEKLKKLGFTGMTLEEAVEAAMASGKKGHVQYAFRQPNELQRLLGAYKAQQQELQEADGTAQDLQLKIMLAFKAGEMDEHEALLRVACVNLKMHVQWKNLWKQQTPMIRIPNGGKPSTRETANGRVTRMPGFKLLSLNAGDDIKKHLKV